MGLDRHQLRAIRNLSGLALLYIDTAVHVLRAYHRWQRWRRWPVVEWWLRLEYGADIEVMMEVWEDYRELAVEGLKAPELTPEMLHMINETLLGITGDLAGYERPPGLKLPSDWLNGGLVPLANI